ncbi:MAG: diacylglycerol kinase [Cellvibrio sp.]
MKSKKVGLARLWAAAGYSLKGFRAAWHFEESFRLEVYVALLSLPCAYYLASSATQLALLILTVGLVMVAELANSAIEAVVDRTGEEFHPLSGRAKDIGSAMVVMTIVIAMLVWVLVALDRFGAIFY